jgi:hypothetical protein
MLASTPSQHLESDYRPRRNPKCESTSKNHALKFFGTRLSVCLCNQIGIRSEKSKPAHQCEPSRQWLEIRN